MHTYMSLQGVCVSSRGFLFGGLSGRFLTGWFLSVPLLVIVIVNSKLLKRHSKAKRMAPAYSRALRQIKGVFSKNSPWEARVRFPEGERMRQIRGVFQRIVRGKLRSGCQKVRGGRLGVKAGVV